SLEGSRPDFYVQVSRVIYQMLKFVRDCTDRDRFHETHGAHILIHRYVRIGNQQIEHFREVARRTSLNAAGGSERKQIPAEEKSAFVEILIRKIQLIESKCEKQYHVLVVVDVG